MKVAVIGAGAWGTTLANLLAKKGVPTSLWILEQELAVEIRKTGRNTWYLPEFELDSRLEITTDLATASQDAELHLMAVPCQFLRSVLQRLVRRLGKRPAMICASKGIELSTLSPMSKVFEDELGDLKARYGHLSGPSFAFEVSKELPTSVALGCADKKLAREVQELFSTSYFRVYTTSDYKGVELGGAVKNIIAIAAGISDGLHFGHDSRAALINRGLAEMSRLGKAMGANPQTFMGLSGMGDLVLTCTGDLSRNRQVGMRLGQGQKLLDILGQMKMVAEGVKTTEAVYKLSKKLGVELPITDQVYSILYEGKDPAAAVKDLMARPLKEES
jgi:glycerol-3-phosphate dehydrogenase (NAD(P)+)